MKALSLSSLLLISLLLCSCGFERKWEQSVADYNSGKVSSPEGPWEGTWTTKTNGHTGDLRAIVTESKKKPGELDFHYHATWGQIFSGGYEVGFPARKSGSTTLVDGKKSLGAFGTFGHKARITRSTFDATYSSEDGDLGNFQMRRPQ